MWSEILVVAIVLFVISLIAYWYNSKKSSMPYYVWFLMALSVLLIVAALTTQGSTYRGDENEGMYGGDENED